MIKLILSDIDGTILPRGNAHVSEKTRDAFHAALDAGIHIGVASGRERSWLPGFFEHDMDCIQTTISSNGCVIYADGELVRRDSLKREDLLALAEFLDTYPVPAGLIAFEGKDIHLVTGPIEVLDKVFPVYGKAAREQTGPWEMPAELMKANVFVDLDAAQTPAFVDEINNHFASIDVDMASPGYLNIMAKGRNKGSALRDLAAHFGLSMDEVAVFGDGENDLEMFKVAGNAIAVSGATPAASAAATHHIGACEDDAVADAIYDIINGKWK